MTCTIFNCLSKTLANFTAWKKARLAANWKSVGCTMYALPFREVPRTIILPLSWAALSTLKQYVNEYKLRIEAKHRLIRIAPSALMAG
jgi:hypothetical protein